MRMTRAAAIGALAALLATSLGCADVAGVTPIRGSGNASRESRPAGDFSEVELRGSLSVVIAPGEAGEVTVAGDDNLIPLVRTERRGRRLVVSTRRPFRTRRELRVVIAGSSPDRVALYGAGRIHLESFTGRSLRIELHSSGTVSAAGEVESLEAELNGSGVLGLFGLRAGAAEVTVAGSGDAEISAVGKLDATIAGSGDVIVRGGPEVVGREISGSGRLILR